MNALIWLFLILLTANIAYANPYGDAREMTSGDIAIEKIEYNWEPEEDPTMLTYSVTVTNVSNEEIKYHPNVQIPKMSQYSDMRDKCTRVLKPGQSCRLTGYGFLQEVNAEEYKVIPFGKSYKVSIILSPTNVRPDDFKDDEEGIKKIHFWVRRD